MIRKSGHSGCGSGCGACGMNNVYIRSTGRDIRLFPDRMPDGSAHTVLAVQGANVYCVHPDFTSVETDAFSDPVSGVFPGMNRISNVY